MTHLIVQICCCLSMSGKICQYGPCTELWEKEMLLWLRTACNMRVALTNISCNVHGITPYLKHIEAFRG